MLLLETHWRRWRRSRSHQLSTVPWLVLLLAAVAHSQGFPPPPHHMHNHHHPPPSGPPMTAQPYITGPSNPPPNFYYQIDNSGGGNKLVQRQMPQGPGGITAAATNYLLQQLQNERQQQQLQHRSLPPPPQHQQQHSMSPQQQTLQLLANLSPQQINALQQVIPTMPRGNSSPAPMLHRGGPHEDGPHPPRMPHSPFSSRIGPFDKLFNRAKSWLPDMMSAGSGNSRVDGGGNSVGEPKMRDMHRLPKPPTYPLYDLPSMGQATPPPAPIMHPMASLPNGAFDMDQPQMQSSMQSSSPRSTGPIQAGSSYNQQNWISPTMSTSRRSRPVPTPRPSKPSFFRNPLARSKKPRPSQEPPNYNRRNHGPPPRGGRPTQRPRPRGGPPITTRPKKTGPPRRPPSGGRRPPPPSSGSISDPYGGSGPGGNQMGFDHPMASNLSPAQSPALGRPLSYDEYMARPSHSYTNDPWNFDPFANQMNQGLHTGSLRYNYDPLGMNALDTEANSHLDPNKLSYPGDSFNQDMVKDSPGIGATGQIGGWDKPFKKRPYDSDPESELTPPGPAFGMGAPSSFPSSSSDNFSPPSSMGSSSNRYKNSGSSSFQSSSLNSSPSEGSGFMGDSLSGGRLGEMPTRDQFEAGGSSFPSFGNDGPPTIDLESLSGPNQDEDGMGGLEFTIETSPQAMDSTMMDESHQPEPHPLGPMQPAPNPYLSDQYNPYADHSSPAASSVPGSPYGPNGYQREQRYGRRRTRNNHVRGPHPPKARRRSLKVRPRPRKLMPQPPPPQTSVPPIPSPTSIVPEGVQIFNEIIRPQIVQSNAPPHHHHQSRHLPPPQHAALRRSLYNAIRHSSRK